MILQENFTLLLYKDLHAPFITINSPLNNTYWNTPPLINLTVYEIFPSYIWYNVSSSLDKKFLVNNSEITLESNFWVNLEQGMFKISFFANDSAGKLNDSFKLVLYKDICAPNITIKNLVNESTVYSAPNILVIIEELFLDSIWYNIAGDPTEIFINNNTQVPLDPDLWESLPLGEFKIIFFARDLAGNIRNITYVFIKDAEEMSGGEGKQDLPPDDRSEIFLYVIIGISAAGVIIAISIYIRKNKYKWQRF
ncbi:MAG: hypothetical protein ACTSR8_03140 [Promethearchaeota archaeon]